MVNCDVIAYYFPGTSGLFLRILKSAVFFTNSVKYWLDITKN